MNKDKLLIELNKSKSILKLQNVNLKISNIENKYIDIEYVGKINITFHLVFKNDNFYHFEFDTFFDDVYYYILNFFNLKSALCINNDILQTISINKLIQCIFSLEYIK